MIRALLSVRFRSIFASLSTKARRKGGKKNTGTAILFALLFIYLFAVIGGMMFLIFRELLTPYRALGLDWLYFAVAGLMGLGFSVIGSVFTTQSQLYDAKDNDFLLSLPIPPRVILITRLIPLLLLDLLFAGIVIVPAIAVYAIFAEFSATGILLQILSLLGICLLSQTVSCILGWGLHLLLSRINKSAASVGYLIVFLGLYFYIYSQAETILHGMAASGAQIADAVRSWALPLYAMGKGCTGAFLPFAVFALICAALFLLVYWVLSVTFLKTALAKRASSKKRKLDLSRERLRTPKAAICRKELSKFLGCPVYLTNMGLGILFSAALPFAALFLKGRFRELLAQAPSLRPFVFLIICGAIGFLASVSCISTPSVSLEGKSIWILKSLPVSASDILHGKLRLHLLLTVPVYTLSGGFTAWILGCSVPQIVLCALLSAVLCVLCGLVGMLSGLKWAKLDYINEAYPCKQSVSVAVTMFGMMGFVILPGALYYFVLSALSPMTFLSVYCVLLCLVCWLLYRLLDTWGVRKWDQL